MAKKQYKMSSQKKATLKNFAEHPEQGLNNAVKKSYNCKHPLSHNSIAWQLKHDKSFKELLKEIDFDPKMPMQKILDGIKTINIRDKQIIPLLKMYYELKGEFIQKIESKDTTKDLDDQATKDALRILEAHFRQEN